MAKAIVCLGNPGPEYATTRHNAGWWFGDRLADAWGFGRFRRQGEAALALGEREGEQVGLLKPLTYMNRSGRALAPLLRMQGFDPARDLLVVVDDVALPPGRARLRMEGSSGGHNGLKSIEATLRSREYPRLRLGVGTRPEEVDLVDWVLGTPDPADADAILDIFDDLLDGVALWIAGDAEGAMARCNAVGPHAQDSP